MFFDKELAAVCLAQSCHHAEIPEAKMTRKGSFHMHAGLHCLIHTSINLTY